MSTYWGLFKILFSKWQVLVTIATLYSCITFAQPQGNFFQDLLASTQNSPVNEWLKYEHGEIKPCQQRKIEKTAMIKAMHAYDLDFKNEEEWELWLDFFCKQRNSTVLLLTLGETYFPLIDSLLIANNLPVVFRYLPVVLSAMNPKSVWSGGAGLWHLYIPYLIKSGLKVSPEYDERLDPEKAAVVAIERLKTLYENNKSVKTSLVGYTFGPFQNKNMQVEYQEEDFLSAFVAIVYLFEHKEIFHFSEVIFEYPETKSVLLPDSIQLDLKQKYSFNVQAIALLNPNHTSLNFIAGTTIRILKQDEENFKQWVQNRIAEPVEIKKIVHKVKPGDNLTSISAQYGVEIKELMEWNSLNSSRIYSGQELIILKGSLR